MDMSEMAKHKRNRDRPWGHDEIIKLIDMWRQNRRRLEGFGSKQQVFTFFEKQFDKLGFRRNSKQIQKKVQNLRQEYSQKKQAGTLAEWTYAQHLDDVVNSTAVPSNSNYTTDSNDQDTPDEVTHDDAPFSILGPGFEVFSGKSTLDE